MKAGVRRLVGLGVLGWTLFHAAGSRGASPAWPWFEHSLLGMEVGPTGAQFGHSDPKDTRYASRFDGREIVGRCAAAGCDYVVIWARDGDYAYHDSKLLPKAPGLGSRDPLHDAVDEGRKQGLPVIAYCVVQQGGHFLAAHPEWEMRGADGKPLGRFCLNSGYLEAMKGIVAEEIAYGIDGLHIDMLDQGFGPPYGCWCRTCKALFEKRYGRPMPPGPTWDVRWDQMLDFRYESSSRFEMALRAHVKTVNPGASVDFNYHGNPPFSWEVGQRPVQHAGNGDFVTGETGVWGFSALTVGLNAEFYHAATPGLPVQVAISRDARMYHNQTARPLADLRWELLTLLAHGAFVTVVDKTAFDGGLDPLAYERIGGAFRDARARRNSFSGQTFAEVGIYFSSRSRDWFGRSKPEDYFQSFLGAHKAMVYEHIPWAVILNENLTLAGLKRFPVVILPGTAILSEVEVKIFREYAGGGGKLIVTGVTGCYDRMGALQASTSIETLTGARFVRRLGTLDNWVRFPSSRSPAAQNRLAPDGRLDWPFLVKGPAILCEPVSAAAVGELMKPSRTTRQSEGREGTEWPMSPEAPVGPAILLNQVGAGEVLTFTCSPDFATASEHHIVEARKLLRNAIRLLQPTPRIEVTAPASVESVVTDDPLAHVLRVHFIAYNAPAQTMPAKNRPYALPALMEDRPMFRATIVLRDRPKSAAAFNKSTRLIHSGRKIEIVAEDVHEVVTIRY